MDGVSTTGETSAMARYRHNVYARHRDTSILRSGIVWAHYTSNPACKVLAKNHDISQLPCDLIVPHRLVVPIQAFKGSNHWGNG